MPTLGEEKDKKVTSDTSVGAYIGYKKRMISAGDIPDSYEEWKRKREAGEA